MSQKQTNPEAAVHPIISGRWSPRAFDENRLIDSTKLAACLEAARWSSSCFGEEPWRFIVADKSNNPDGWQKLLEALVEGNRVWAKNAPVLILACASQAFAHNANPNRWAQYDTGQAMMALSLQAVDEGLISHPMGGFSSEAAQQAFAIPDDFALMSVTALGYQGKAASLPEHYSAIEMGERKRKPLSEIAFTSWNTSWQADEKS
ncbi:MAG: nitroreductase family protein [Mariprofundus sp.]|nr:nitroreductase family protein [Mariprofundus sp.]